MADHEVRESTDQDSIISQRIVEEPWSEEDHSIQPHAQPSTATSPVSRPSGSVRHRPAALEASRSHGNHFLSPIPSCQTAGQSSLLFMTMDMVVSAKVYDMLTLYAGSSHSGRLPNLPPKTPRKTTISKRSASSATAHTRKEFSVDDSQDEVDADHKLARTTSHTLRRQPSNLNRRPMSHLDDDPRSGDKLHRPIRLGPVRQPSSGESDDTLRPDHESETGTVEEVETSFDPEGEDVDDGDYTPEDDEDDDNDDTASDHSDAESFTLKDRQQAINETHPFGIRIWKPALYKKDRSIQKNAEADVHQSPGGYVSFGLFLFNLLWTLIFGWPLALIVAVGGILCKIASLGPGSPDYGTVLLRLAAYILYPFGKFVKLELEEDYLDEDEGEGRTVTEYERWQNGHLEEGRLFFGPVHEDRSLVGARRDSSSIPDETDSLLGRPRRHRQSVSSVAKTKKRPFGRGKWTAGRVVYFAFFYAILVPTFSLVSGICWFLIFTVPMARVTGILLSHLRRHPLAMTFHSDSHSFSRPDSAQPSILLCTYRAVGLKYWKYTIDGTNIILVNLLATVAFAIIDYYVLRERLHIDNFVTTSGFIFLLSLLSVIPLAYFIGQAVASISAQSTMGVGATVNAFFSTVVEVYLYCVALNQGKARLVEGSIIGSIFAGILLMPGMSMCFGAIRRKTQRFNVKSAGVTSTMLMFAIIGSFGPTLFYQIYGSHELACHQCIEVDPKSPDRDCRRCYFNQAPAVHDNFFVNAVRPYTWFCAALLFLSYVIGLLFTLRTHAAIIWSTDVEEKKGETHKLDVHGEMRSATFEPSHHSRQGTTTAISAGPKESIRDSQLYKRILGQSLKHAGYVDTGAVARGTISTDLSPVTPRSPFLVPPKSADGELGDPSRRASQRKGISGLSAEDNNTLVRQVAELAATAATVAARDANRAPRKASHMMSASANSTVPRGGGDNHAPSIGTVLGEVSRSYPGTVIDATEGHPPPGVHGSGAANGDQQEAGGHDAPNWSRTKSSVILLTATIAYAIIAEILVDTVDVVLDNVEIDEKFLGITLFALVPNTTEFLNAISFAMNGNIALSMEIGSAYALQVMLLQAPALVFFSAFQPRWIPDPAKIVDHTFSLIFPQWDMVTVILGLFLMNYVVGEGKSNYFKGSMLILSYLVVIVGFWLTGFNDAGVSLH